MCAATGDARFKERADYLVGELKEIQETHGDGYLGALDGGADASASRQVAAGDIRSSGFDLNGLWSPWYALHKIFAGLRDAYRYTGNQHGARRRDQVRGVGGEDPLQARRRADPAMLNTEFGGMNEILADLYADTGDRRWLALSDRFEHHAIVDPLERPRTSSPGSTAIPRCRSSPAASRDSSSRRLRRRQAPRRSSGIRSPQHHSFATGGHGRNEYFGEPDKLNARSTGGPPRPATSTTCSR